MAKKPTMADVQRQLDEAQAANAALRSMVDTQTVAATAHQQRLATALPGHRAQFAELMVGVRNISDTTVGVKALFKGDSDLQLNADFGKEDPARTQIISYAWWRELRKSPYVGKGLLIRDDSTLGSLYQAAPPDLPGELAPGHAVNAIPDPKAWVESRDETALREGVAAITSEESLRRLRRVVDEALVAFESTQPRNTVPEQVKAARLALNSLPAKLRMLDDLVTSRLENPVDAPPEDTGPLRIR